MIKKIGAEIRNKFIEIYQDWSCYLKDLSLARNVETEREGASLPLLKQWMDFHQVINVLPKYWAQNICMMYKSFTQALFAHVELQEDSRFLETSLENIAQSWPDTYSILKLFPTFTHNSIRKKKRFTTETYDVFFSHFSCRYFVLCKQITQKI